MIVKVKVHANSSCEKIVKSEDNYYEVWCKEKAISGKANSKLIKIFKNYLNLDVKIKSGFKSKIKLLEY